MTRKEVCGGGGRGGERGGGRGIKERVLYNHDTPKLLFPPLPHPQRAKTLPPGSQEKNGKEKKNTKQEFPFYLLFLFLFFDGSFIAAILSTGSSSKKHFSNISLPHFHCLLLKSE